MPCVPTVALCLLANDPPERLRAVVEPLRPIVDEIVIGADSRVPAETRAAYAELADRVPVFELGRNIEQHLGWLHEQTSADWILRLDGDEVAGAELTAALPVLVCANDVRQYWLPRRWVSPNGRGWLDELPWAPDYQGRLVRNDGGLSFSGRSHSGVDRAGPARYLREPIYHLVCALETKEERVVRSFRYELLEPLQVAPGGGPFNATYYLPERFARRPAARLPPADRPLVDAALTTSRDGG
jgi:hypothetical protein